MMNITGKKCDNRPVAPSPNSIGIWLPNPVLPEDGSCHADQTGAIKVNAKPAAKPR